MVMEPCTWVMLCSGDLKAWMLKVGTGPLCEGYLVTSLTSHSPFKSIAIAPCNLVTLTDSPSHALFGNFVSQGKGGAPKTSFCIN